VDVGSAIWIRYPDPLSGTRFATGQIRVPFALIVMMASGSVVSLRWLIVEDSQGDADRTSSNGLCNPVLFGWLDHHFRSNGDRSENDLRLYSLPFCIAGLMKELLICHYFSD